MQHVRIVTNSGNWCFKYKLQFLSRTIEKGGGESFDSIYNTHDASHNV